MRRRNLQFTAPNWLKWAVIGISVVLISCFVYLIVLYSDIQQSRTLHYNDSKEVVLDQTKVSKIEKITEYHGESQYHVLFGSTADGQNKIVYVPLNSKQNELTVIDVSKIIPKEQIREQWEQQCQNCELVDITPAMESDEALWEVTYINGSDRYIFDYLSIYDGTRFQQYRLKSIFH